MRAIWRVDPADCACVECKIGWSVPVNRLTFKDIDYILLLDVDDESGYTEREWDDLIFKVCVEPFDDDLVPAS